MHGNYNSVQCCNRKFANFHGVFPKCTSWNEWFYKIGDNIYKLCTFLSTLIEINVI